MSLLIVLVLFTAQAVSQASTCWIPASMTDAPYENIAYALQNVSCPTNWGYLEILTFHDTSSVLDSCSQMLAALKDSNSYMANSDAMTSEAGVIYYSGPANALTDDYWKWVSQLVTNKQTLYNQGIGQSLQAQLMQQRDETKTFLDTVLSKIWVSDRADANSTLSPIFDHLDCGIQAFANKDSSVAVCPQNPSDDSTDGSGTTTTQPFSTTTSAASGPTSTTGGTDTFRADSLRVAMAFAGVVLVASVF
nr:hypothetical protein CFP56_04282 [Quercus suber]